MKLLSFALGLILLLATPALATNGGTQATLLGDQFNMNQGAKQGLVEAKLGDKLIKETVHTLKLQYSFAVQGGAIGAINLVGEDGKAAKLPKGAIVRDCLIDVVTAPTSGGAATIAFGTGQAANDLKAATAIASITGLVACVPVGTAATAIKLTLDRTPTITVAAFALTAGKFYVHIEYLMSSTTVP